VSPHSCSSGDDDRIRRMCCWLSGNHHHYPAVASRAPWCGGRALDLCDGSDADTGGCGPSCSLGWPYSYLHPRSEGMRRRRESAWRMARCLESTAWRMHCRRWVNGQARGFIQALASIWRIWAGGMGHQKLNGPTSKNTNIPFPSFSGLVPTHNYLVCGP
jgi:hypothetical protein